MGKRTTFIIRVADQPGALAEVTAALWRRGIDIQSLSVDVNESDATIHLVVSQPAAAREAFAEHGWAVSEE
ncbi:MAG: ACT domain-containing protein [Terriglobia bacterium]